MASQSLNRINQAPVKGELDLKFNPNSVSVQIDVTSAGALPAGQPVKFVDSSGGVPKVVECALNSDDVAGFINYNLKNKTFDAYDYAEISLIQGGNCMYMEASAAIARHASVAIVVAGQKVVTATSGLRIIGIAFDKAAASGDLIRVLLLPPAALA